MLTVRGLTDECAAWGWRRTLTQLSSHTTAVHLSEWLCRKFWCQLLLWCFCFWYLTVASQHYLRKGTVTTRMHFSILWAESWTKRNFIQHQNLLKPRISRCPEFCGTESDQQRSFSCVVSCLTVTRMNRRIHVLKSTSFLFWMEIFPHTQNYVSPLSQSDESSRRDDVQ